uniref:HscB mitochondrial iron-sulfur cluster cochaperone n=1 Tax=Strix occidentalis caurina TaxID=311401 RepID=A0A8D0KRD6_STROC
MYKTAGLRDAPHARSSRCRRRRQRAQTAPPCPAGREPSAAPAPPPAWDRPPDQLVPSSSRSPRAPRRPLPRFFPGLTGPAGPPRRLPPSPAGTRRRHVLRGAAGSAGAAAPGRSGGGSGRSALAGSAGESLTADCGRPLPGAEGPPRFCGGCRALQPPGPRPDLFRLMGCDRSFRVDAQQLRRRFRSLQRAVHPDRFGQRPPVSATRYYSEQHSSLINKAYQTLLNPLSRGLYLLELNGVEPAQETDCDADSEFLMEIMEINEKLAEPKNEGTLEEIETLIQVKQEELTKEVTAAFERGDLQEAKKFLAKMKYFANLEDKVKHKKIPS